MVAIKVLKPFIGNDRHYHAGEIALIPEKALSVLADRVKVITLQSYLDEHIAGTDAIGHPWPRGFFQDLTAEDRQQLRALEEAIDTAVIANDAEALPDLLTKWRKLLLSKLN